MEFVAPDKGQWVSLRDHFPRALTPQLAELLPEALATGESIPFAAYGLPVKTLTIRLVRGHVYVAPEPLAGRASNRLPPLPVLWLVVRLLPAFRRRARAAREALAARPWLDEAARWYASERGEWRDANLALQAEDPDALGQADLVAHLRRCRDHVAAGYRRHFALHGPDLLPTGLLLARCQQWGIPSAEVLPLLDGASPASRGAPDSLETLRAEVAAAGAHPASVEELRTLAPSAFDAFVADYGWRLITGYDLDSRALVELPALLLTLAVSSPVPRTSESEVDPLTVLRERVPAADVAELERLVADARATFGVRDDNGGLTGAWPMGLLRRAMLAAGRQLAASGLLAAADHAFELTVDELAALVETGAGPTKEEVSERARDRAERSMLAPPLQLGPTLDIPLRALPSAMRLMSRAQLEMRDMFTAPLDGRSDLVGDGIGTDVYQGRACLAPDPAAALERIEPGDVLVALGTTPAFNLVLSLAGAVVVEEGGLLSHAAVIARELGIAAVVGVAGAMATIPDGSIVEVDPRAGTVRVVSSSLG